MRQGRRSPHVALPLDPDFDDIEPPPGPLRRVTAHWRTLLLIAAGGAVGGLARYEIGLAWTTTGGTFPWPTFAINTSGALVLALLVVVVTERATHAGYVRAALGTGLCGAYTTFSSVVVSADRLAAHGHPGLAAGYVAASLGAGIVAAALGLAGGESLADIGRTAPC